MPDDLFKYLPSILVVGGWCIAYQLQALQARRKVLREEIEKTRAAVESLNSSALGFHLEKFSAVKRWEILRAIEDVERRCTLLPVVANARALMLRRVLDPSKMTIDPRLFVELRQSITLEHFDDPDQDPLKHEAQQLRKISASCFSISSALDSALITALD